MSAERVERGMNQNNGGIVAQRLYFIGRAKREPRINSIL